MSNQETSPEQHPVMAAPQPPVDYEAKFERIASALAAGEKVEKAQ